MYNFYPKLICKLHAIPIKILTCLLMRPDNLTPAFIWKRKKPRIVKTLMKNKVGGTYLTKH